MATAENESVREHERWPRLVGGDPALDFVNTEIVTGGKAEADLVRSEAEFLAWCSFAGILPAATVDAPAAAAQEDSLVVDAIALRSAVRSILEAVIAGRDAEGPAWATLRSAYADAIAHAEPVLAEGNLRWRWASEPRAALRMLANSAVDLLRSDVLQRIKACPGCGFFFRDTTRNGSRRWCAMEDCGTREKVQRYVTKRARARVPDKRPAEV
jgi:predicted RNA-binding Zn ribbon-like protein